MVRNHLNYLSFLIVFVLLFSIAGCSSKRFIKSQSQVIVLGKNRSNLILNNKPKFRRAKNKKNYNGCVAGQFLSLNINKLTEDTIELVVVDSDSNEPLPFINVSFMDDIGPNQLTINLMTDSSGLVVYTFDKAPKFIVAHYVGYARLSLDIRKLKVHRN